jgi:aspartyl-tRNA(Asn)/glutamyl-tRNA(Gln) amidotransferase subunit A
VAAGACTFALGTDTGGSIRIPASLTGTVGLKPTWGTIPVRGVFPLSTSLDTVGSIAQTVADAMIAWRSLRRQGERIASTMELLEATRSLAGRRIGLLGGHFAKRVQPDVLAATESAAAALASLGAEIVRVDWADAAVARATGLMIQRIEAAAVHATALRESAELMGEDLRSRLEVGSLMSGVEYIDALKAREAVKASIEALYRDEQLDAVLAPSTAATAPRADAQGITFDDGVTESFGVAMTRLTTPWNATGQPVISVPAGFDRDGLPIGLSVVGKPYDEMTIAVIAHAYEQATDWHTRRAMT